MRPRQRFVPGKSKYFRAMGLTLKGAPMTIVSVSIGSGTVAPPLPLRVRGCENSALECMRRKENGVLTSAPAAFAALIAVLMVVLEELGRRPSEMTNTLGYFVNRLLWAAASSAPATGGDVTCTMASSRLFLSRVAVYLWGL